MKLELEVISAKLLRSEHGPDRLELTTALADGCYPFQPDSATFRMYIAHGLGETYIAGQFPSLEYTLIEI